MVLLAASHHGASAGSVSVLFVGLADPAARGAVLQDKARAYGVEDDFEWRARLDQAVFDKTGKWPVLYSGESFLRDNMKGVRTSPLAECSLWLAKYSLFQPKAPDLWKGWDLWQYSSKGEVPGISKPVDRNRWQGSEAGLFRWWDG